jgi:Mg2+ and Co2+ transporter CorA
MAVISLDFLPTALVTVRYHPVETFDLFAQKLCKASAQALFPDAVALGLINTGLNRSARALSKAGESLDRIASAIFRAKSDQSKRNQIYSDTLDALGREDEKGVDRRCATCRRWNRTRASRRKKCSSCWTRRSAVTSGANLTEIHRFEFA